MLVVREKKSVSIAELSHGLHFYKATFIVGAVRQKIMTISWTIPPIFDLVDQVFEPSIDQPLLLPFQGVFFSNSANLRRLSLHLFKIDTAMLLSSWFLD